MDSSHNHDRTTPRVGIVCDDRMCQHSAPDGKKHVENPNRIKAIWSKLEASGILKRCEDFSATKAEDRFLASVHTKQHIKFIRNLSSKACDRERSRIAAELDSIYLNEGSSQAAYLAAGSVIEMFFELDKREGRLFESKNIAECFEDFDQNMFTEACIMGGCDYSKQLMPINNAIEKNRRFKICGKVLEDLRVRDKYVPEDEFKN